MPQANEAPRPLTDDEARQQMRRLSRRSFAVGAATALAGFAGWGWLRTRSPEAGIPWPLRRALEFNERLTQAYFKDTRLAPDFPRDRAREPRVNGMEGLPERFDPSAWRLNVEGNGVQAPLQLAAIQALPRVEMVTEFKCVEGWSEVVHWAGARLTDFIAACSLATRSGRRPEPGKFDDLVNYVALETPDGSYYVGIDMPSALHPQTLLCYEMNGAPLTRGHGAPLRLVIPLKYGIKNLKRIGTIRFTDERPKDFWAQRGYDWYAGH